VLREAGALATGRVSNKVYQFSSEFSVRVSRRTRHTRLCQGAQVPAVAGYV